MLSENMVGISIKCSLIAASPSLMLASIVSEDLALEVTVAVRGDVFYFQCPGGRTRDFYMLANIQ